jgi:hypothetical protein
MDEWILTRVDALSPKGPDGMDERVEEDEDPDGHRHVAHASPHTHHGTGMVVRLEG